MAPRPLVLILGSGPRIGAAVAKRFASEGYSVAIASRSVVSGKTAEGCLAISADLSNPTSIPAIFARVQVEFQTRPNIIVYNGAAMTRPTGDDLFSIPVSSLATDLNINTISLYAAAQEAVKGWLTMPSDVRKVFIYTGNKLNVWVSSMTAMTTLGAGKSASAYLIGAADGHYRDQGFRFFYADERNTDGSVKGMQVDGEAHAEFYAQLVEGAEHIPWHATFVKGSGHVKFD